MYDDPIMYAKSKVWNPKLITLFPSSVATARKRKLHRLKGKMRSPLQVVVLSCFDSRPEGAGSNAGNDLRLPQPFANSRSDDVMFFIPRYDAPYEALQNGPWWFYCDEGAILVEEEVPIWPWLGNYPEGRNVRIQRRCVQTAQKEELTVEVASKTTSCGDFDPWTTNMVEHARAKRKSGGALSNFYHITIHDLRNIAKYPNAPESTDPERTPIDHFIPISALQPAKRFRACLHNDAAAANDVELIVTTKERSADVMREDMEMD